MRYVVMTKYPGLPISLDVGSRRRGSEFRNIRSTLKCNDAMRNRVRGKSSHHMSERLGSQRSIRNDAKWLYQTLKGAGGWDQKRTRKRSAGTKAIKLFMKDCLRGSYHRSGKNDTGRSKRKKSTKRYTVPWVRKSQTTPTD